MKISIPILIFLGLMYRGSFAQDLEFNLQTIIEDSLGKAFFHNFNFLNIVNDKEDQLRMEYDEYISNWGGSRMPVLDEWYHRLNNINDRPMSYDEFVEFKETNNWLTIYFKKRQDCTYRHAINCTCDEDYNPFNFKPFNYKTNFLNDNLNK